MTDYGMRREARDGGQVISDSQKGPAAIPQLPGDGLSGGQFRDVDHSPIAAAHDMPREGRGSGQLDRENHTTLAATTSHPARDGDCQDSHGTHTAHAVAEQLPERADAGRRRTETQSCNASVQTSPQGRGGHRLNGNHGRYAAPQIRSDAGPSADDLPNTIPAALSATPSPQGEAGGQSSGGPHFHDAPSHGIGSESHHPPETPYGGADASDTVSVIRQLWRRRQRWHQAEKSLTLQCSAICRGAADGSKTEAAKILKRIETGDTEPGDIDAMIATAPLLAARGAIRAERLAVEKALGKLARQLPVYAWTKTVYGVGDLSLAAIVGEAGDVASYKSVSALWKRMGLAVINGERQRRKSGDEAFDHGYSPRRRSVMWNIGGGLIGGMGKGPRLLVGEAIDDRPELTPYQRLFVERIRFEAERDEKMQRDPTKCPKTGLPRESFSAHAANRAKRYVEKRFLRDLYAQWRKVSREVETVEPLLSSDPIPPNGGAERHLSIENHRGDALGNSSRESGAVGQRMPEIQDLPTDRN